MRKANSLNFGLHLVPDILKLTNFGFREIRLLSFRTSPKHLITNSCSLEFIDARWQADSHEEARKCLRKML